MEPVVLVDPYLRTKDHKKWSLAVMKRAGYQCEWNEGGIRCERAYPPYQLHAHHVEERRDAPERALAADNGKCLCVQHHTIITNRERAKRAAK